jgi:hypothetical protein
MSLRFSYDHIFITVRLLRVCRCGELSLTRGRVCNLLLLLVLANAVIFESESRGTRAHILLPRIRDFPIRRLLHLAGLRWRYSKPPPHGILTAKIKVTVTLRLAVYRHSARLGVKHFETHDQIFFSTELLR